MTKTFCIVIIAVFVVFVNIVEINIQSKQYSCEIQLQWSFI